ncbi:anti-sigma factor domain-containing protein [Skermania piniformis]|uniref:Regulator of SigK n=1 Tax=Skermania pinensis TaxID=39122 RepID=A0ABX8SA37_9ACTN|nr:anti-sigma factor [Skermania piniformis]QXQ13849.1 anti-sigma factor [Skermania piniformis]
MTSADIHTLAGAYALDAIDPDERIAFDAHLAECESCRDEVDGLWGAAAALAVIEHPPARLRARVHALAERTAQLPPLVAPRRPARARRWSRLAAAAAVVVAIGLGGVVLREVTERPAEVTAGQVFGARDAHTRAVPLGTGELRVAVSAQLDRIAVDGGGMPAPPAGHAYQVWLVDGAQPTSLSVMEGDATTAVTPIPPAGVLAITIEPSGGSAGPTTEPILTLDPAGL